MSSSNAATAGSKMEDEPLATKTWHGVALPRGYTDMTDQIDIKGLEALNADGEYGSVRALFEATEPVSLGSGKAALSEPPQADWVQSDTDEQLMLFIPFQSTLKVHGLQITSLPHSGEGEATMRPKTIRLFVNRPNGLGFEEAEDITPTQELTLSASDFDNQTHTARVDLRFVKFQNVSSLVVFVVDGDGDDEKVRIDRIRVVGEAGEKRSMGKLEKIGDEQGE